VNYMPLSTDAMFQSFPFLQQTRVNSLLLCEQLELALTELKLSSHSVVSVFAVGSLGRLEVGSPSDLDGVVVVDSDYQGQNNLYMMREIEECYRKLGFRVAKASGIYRLPIEVSPLIDLSQRGRLDEQPEIYGKRIQMLLDARPIYAPGQFAKLQSQVLEWFLPSINGEFSYDFIINELQRYFHSYTSWQSFKFDKSEDDGWYLRQAKLRVTRVTTIAAMMMLVGLSIDIDDHDTIRKQLAATPVERLIFVFDHYNESELLARFLSLYERALILLLNEDLRDELITESPQNLEEAGRPFPPCYQQLYEISEELMELLTAFSLGRQNDWPSSFYRNWLF
jgi:hypothetical protein